MSSRRQRGFGLVEIMISVTLGLILTAALLQMVLGAQQSYMFSETMARVQDTGRFGIDLISRDIRRAGYLGLYSKVRDDDGRLLVGGTLGYAPAANTCVADDNSWARIIERPLYGLDDGPAGYACIPANAYLRGDIVVTRFAEPDPVGIAGTAVPGKSYQANALYIRTAMMEARIFAGGDRSDALNEVLDSPQTDHALQAVAYYVGNTARSCQGQKIPALFRVHNDADGKPAREELMSGVQDLQLEYQVGNQYLDAGNVADWRAVNAVRVSLLVRADCPETGYSDLSTYSYADTSYTAEAGSVDSRFRRRLYTSVVSLRNSL
jgi:type IV pilus assembly protein PilW